MTLPSLATRARRVLAGAGVSPDDVILVACSGGLDSQVLLDVLAHVSRQSRMGGFALVAHSIDHGLRREAAEEVEVARALAVARGVFFHATTLSLLDGPSLQVRAREARRAALDQAAVAAQSLTHAKRAWIATAHHADDRAETVLMRLLRGAPLAALGVLPPNEGPRLRPLIGVRRAQLLQHARARGLEWREDPSNRDRRYLRVRVRLDVLPLLQELDPRVVEHLCERADEACALDGGARGALRAALPEGTSARAVAAIELAVSAALGAARVPLRGGVTARWDASVGVVVEPTRHRRDRGIQRDATSPVPEIEPIDGGAPRAIAYREPEVRVDGEGRTRKP